MRRVPIVLTLVLAQAASAQPPTPYSITQTYTLGGEGFWDYVVPDPPSHRVYIGRQTRVMVVDEDSGKLLGEVTGINGAHGTAIVADTGHGFATSSEDKSVVMFDLKSLKQLARIPAAEDADAIIYDPASKRVFSLNGDANSATVIEPRGGTHVTDIALGGKPEYAASAGDGKVDYKSGKVVATAPIEMGVDGSGYDPATGDVFTSNGEGTLTVIHEDSPDRYTVVQNLATSPGSRNMGLDPTTHTIFVVTAKFGPPAAGARRGAVLPDSFGLLVIQRSGG